MRGRVHVQLLCSATYSLWHRARSVAHLLLFASHASSQASPIVACSLHQSSKSMGTETELLNKLKKMPVWQKALLGVVAIIVVGFVGFMLARDVFGGCDCPRGYLNTDPAGDSCACQGTSLTCKYNCGDGRCFVNGENKNCNDIDESWAKADVAKPSGGSSPAPSSSPASSAPAVSSECANAFDSQDRCTQPCGCDCSCSSSNGDSGCDCKKGTAAAGCCKKS